MFRNTTATQSTDNPATSLDRLARAHLILSEFLCNKVIPFNESMEFVLLLYLAAGYTLIYEARNLASAVHSVIVYELRMDDVYSRYGHLYFKNLLILKGITEQPIEIQNQLHTDLMKRLLSPNGFAMLCRNVLPIELDAAAAPLWKRAEIVYHIVGHRGHSPQFTRTIVDEIYRFYAECLRKTKSDQHEYRLACVGSLSKIYANHSGRRQQIDAYLMGKFDVLCEPSDLLTGCIVMDDTELRFAINCNWSAFCAPTAIGLPSKCLVRYLPVLLRLHSQLVRDSDIESRVSHLIVQCLANRGRAQLKTLTDVLITEEYPSDMRTIHARVHVKQMAPSKLYTVQIGDAASPNEYDAAATFLRVLKQSQHNVFVYNVFVHLLEGIEGCLMTSGSSANADLLTDFGELELGLTKRFKRQVTTMYLLSELISYKSFHSQFDENPQEIVAALQTILQHRIDGIRQTDGRLSVDIDESVLVVVLLIVREILPKLRTSEELVRTLKRLDACCASDDLRQEIRMIFQLVDGTMPERPNSDGVSEFQMARRLCEERQPHLIVCGLMKFVQLIRHDRDPETLACKHAVLAIAVHCLRNEESYVFLNCIKLLILLVDVLEVEVIECVVAEYKTEDNLMDFRLKMGEVIVKVTEGLGELFDY